MTFRQLDLGISRPLSFCLTQDRSSPQRILRRPSDRLKTPHSGDPDAIPSGLMERLFEAKISNLIFALVAFPISL
jgi:hypothetical protein